MHEVLIFANGIMEDVAWTRPFFPTKTAVLAANGGSKHLYKLNEPPDVLIGDMDSLEPEIKRWLANHHCQLVTSPAEKNETDLELALLYAAENYDAEILLFGTLGGRLDQTLANILLLTHPKLTDARIKLVTENEEAWLVRERGVVNGRIHDTLSLIPLKNDVYIKTTTGLQYPLHEETLAFGPARGISNVLTQPTATVEIASGLLLCIHTKSRE